MAPRNEEPQKRTADTPQARAIINLILTELFDGSQLKLAEESGVGVSAVSRLVTGKRPATPEQIGLMVAALPKSWARRLMEAFLSDVAAATKASGFAVTVSTR